MKRGQFSYKLYLTFIALLIVVVLISSVLLFVNTRQQALVSASNTLEANTQQMAYLLDNVFHQINVHSLHMTAAPDLQSFYQTESDASVRNPGFQKILNSVASQFVVAFDQSTRITVYCPDGSFASLGIPCQSQVSLRFFSSESFPDWYATRNDFPDHTTILPPEKDLWSQKDVEYISFLRRLNNAFTFEQVGIIDIQIAPSSLQSVAEGIRFDSADYHLIDHTGTVYVSSAEADPDHLLVLLDQWKELKRATFTSDDHHLVSVVPLPDSALLLIQTQPIDEAVDVVGDFALQMIVIFLILIVVFLVLVFFLIDRLTRPLHELQWAIAEISPVRGDDPPADEFSLMQTSFLTLKERLNAAVSEAVDAKTRQEHAQYVALQAQINPHFTFNAISVIAATAVQNGDMQIYEIASAFSDMLRYILSDTAETVTFATELQHCRAYLRIMQSRYENQLEIRLDVPDSVRHIPMPKLSLQPLLENCFKHGFDAAFPPYTISMTVFLLDRHLTITVQDNGTGMDQQKLEQLRQHIYCADGPIARTEQAGLGLRSSFLRLKQLYPDTNLDLRAMPNHGCAVTITFTLPEGKETFV